MFLCCFVHDQAGSPFLAASEQPCIIWENALAVGVFCKVAATLFPVLV